MEMIYDMREVILFAQRSQRAPIIVKEELTAALLKSGLAVEGTAKELAPINFGLLRDSITPSLQYPNMIVSAQKDDYAPVMEYGRTPGARMPPDGPIRQWMQRKGLDHTDDGLVYVIRRAISVNGIKGRRYMARSLERNAPRIRTFFTVAGSNISRRAYTE
jgi:hypothetical protein